MSYKVSIFIIIQFIPLIVWFYLLKKKEVKVDWRLIASYFIFGSWFGMMGELFLYKLIDLVFHTPIWEYRILPVHNGITSSLGPIMWGVAAIYVCFHKNYQLFPLNIKNPIKLFLLESGFLMVLELIFNFIGFYLFSEYFFYYFVPDLWHWSSFTNMPFWWMGYKIMVKFSSVLYKEEKLNLSLAIIIITVLFFYQ
tara:strand:+ start:6438 stop:7025 length:588 start_codon:yes stop_codon:yes gene_type:complete